MSCTYCTGEIQEIKVNSMTLAERLVTVDIQLRL